MAARLLDAGYEVQVWNRTPAHAAGLAASGASLVGTPRDAASGAEVVVSMLATPEAVTGVVKGTDGLAAAMAPGTCLIEMSTIGPTAARSIAGMLPSGSAMLDAPVLGSIPQATDGTLTIFVGGDPTIYERWSGLLGAMGRSLHIGSLGAGAAMKVVVNSTLVNLMTTLGESLWLADEFGLPRSTVLDILEDSPIGTTVRSKRALLDSQHFPARFKLALAAKDARLAISEAEATGVDLRLVRAALSWFDEAVDAGFGALDYSAITAYQQGRAPAD